MISTIRRSIPLFLLLAAGTASAAGPSEWCPPPTAPWNANHGLAGAQLPPDYAKAAVQENREAMLASLTTWWERYVVDNRLDKARLAEVYSGLAAMHSNDALLWGAWKPTVRRNANGNDVMSIDLNEIREGLAIRLPCGSFDKESEAVSHFAYTLTTLSFEDVKERMPIVAAQATAVYGRYFARLKNGLPMWPQELWVNGYQNDEYADAPSPIQWVFLRPSALAAMKFKGQTGSQVDVALAVEPIGFVRYLDRDQSKKWIGVSALVAVSNDNGIGFGGVLRYNNYVVGVARHKKDSSTLLYVGVDFYRLLMKDTASNNASEFGRSLAEHLRSAVKKELSTSP